NGVFVNQVRVLEDVLRDGDLLRIGQSQLRFEMADPDDVDDTTTGLLLLRRGSQPPEAGMMAWEEDRDWRNPDDAEADGPGVQIWATDDGRRTFHVEHPLAVRAL